MPDGEIILYNTEDGRAEIQLRAVDDTVWLTQAQMAELFATSPQAITQLIRSIHEDAEITEEATCKELLQVRSEGGRQVRRSLKHYNLEMILAVGYRVRSPRGVQFRRWATSALGEYLVKGFVMNDDRLKDPAWDYFDELLERIRDIRTSEARLYLKVRDILALNEDYDAGSPAASAFYATIQNKMLYAVTSHTAGELIRARANPGKPNMGLTTWKHADKGRALRKSDAGTAKNYLGEAEIKELNLIVETFLNTAELRARRCQTMRLAEWEAVLDNFLESNELPRLRGAGLGPGAALRTWERAQKKNKLYFRTDHKKGAGQRRDPPSRGREPAARGGEGSGRGWRIKTRWSPPIRARAVRASGSGCPTPPWPQPRARFASACFPCRAAPLPCRAEPWPRPAGRCRSDTAGSRCALPRSPPSGRGLSWNGHGNALGQPKSRGRTAEGGSARGGGHPSGRGRRGPADQDAQHHDGRNPEPDLPARVFRVALRRFCVALRNVGAPALHIRAQPLQRAFVLRLPDLDAFFQGRHLQVQIRHGQI